MKRIEYIQKIITAAARFVLEVEGFNATNQYHINIHAEAFLIPVFNVVFGLQLENLNDTQKKNFPAIDLADFKNRVAFQITATAGLDKIKSTLEKFKNHNLDKHFDVLYIYIITEKQQSYSQDKLTPLLPTDFQFDATNHILDKDGLIQKINAISSTTQLELISKLFEHEFSDVQIETRQQKFQHGYLGNESEKISPNFLEITFQHQFYTADVDFDEEAVTKEINDYLVSKGKKEVKKIRKEKLIRNVLRKHKSYSPDWLLHNGKIFTFRDLNDNKESLRVVVNTGTIEAVDSIHYATLNEDTNRVFKYLLRQTLQEFCFQKGIEFFPNQGIFRFANNRIAPNQKKMKWKGKKEATKTVIFEIINKKEQHIICFRSLAFRTSFEHFDDKWYMTINPTWSFTNPGGYMTSRFEPSYMSGIKRMENNNAVYNYFRFFGYYLTYTDLFTKDYPHLKIGQALSFEFSPKLEESKWKPVKLPDKKNTGTVDVDIEPDNELDLTLFDL